VRFVVQKYKLATLPPRTKLYGWDYNKAKEFCMTGKEWGQYARVETFKFERGNDAAYSGNGIEVWLDGKDINQR
jgi:hypothetical protein